MRRNNNFSYSRFDFKIFRLRRTKRRCFQSIGEDEERNILTRRRDRRDSISLLARYKSCTYKHSRSNNTQRVYTNVFTIHEMIVIRVIKALCRFCTRQKLWNVLNLIIERRKMTKGSSYLTSRVKRWWGLWFAFYIFLAIDYSLRKV